MIVIIRHNKSKRGRMTKIGEMICIDAICILLDGCGLTCTQQIHHPPSKKCLFHIFRVWGLTV